MILINFGKDAKVRVNNLIIREQRKHDVVWNAKFPCTKIHPHGHLMTKRNHVAWDKTAIKFTTNQPILDTKTKLK
jgi:hypothetical protein